ncbi:MAG TPA: penicillin-binding transpeptidase domain-containing protein [Verrucomicrobiae bacterium]
MLIFDQLKKNDPQLRMLALLVLAGLLVLGCGLWWVQIVSAREYRANLETQSVRTIRIPAVRGKILDRNGIALAENGPTYNISLYLEELSSQFREEYQRLRSHQIEVVTNHVPIWKRVFGYSGVRTQFVKLARSEIDNLVWTARNNVVSNAIFRVSQDLRRPLSFDPREFKRHYLTRLALPFPVAENIGSSDIAKFAEQSANIRGMDLDIQSTRYYPFETTAAHLLGHLRKDDSSVEGEVAFFNYRLPDFRGAVGLEYAFDSELHGRAGAKSVVVNNLGYRQNENILSPGEPGKNVVLTLDLHLQEAAQKALGEAAVPAPVRGAAVVMDVRSGDVLAMVSLPTFDPNYFVQGFPPGEYQRIQSLTAEKNRATQENYRPGSIFKPVVALACLENGMNPNALYEVEPNPQRPSSGIIYVGRRAIRDTVPPGMYNFKRALIHSSNAYFIHNGLQPGNLEKIIELGEQLHLGETFDLDTRQETSGSFPNRKRIRSNWTDGDTANLCIGQGYLDITPMQMTIVAAALANGGKVLWPRLVDRIESQDPDSKQAPKIFPKGRVRDTLRVKRNTLQILENAMIDDTESPEGTAYHAFKDWPHQNEMRVCGKTGTAQVQDIHNRLLGYTTWFLSFAPYENPRYAVVIMVENGSSGGGTCAPIARAIYEAIVAREHMNNPGTIARNR